MTNFNDTVTQRFMETSQNFKALCDQSAEIARIGMQITERMRRGGMVMFCGNGGSAADAQHLAAELQGRFLHDRRPLASVALTTNTSIITAIGNDYGYEQIFDRQLIGLGKEHDTIIGLSTSGNSENVLRAFGAAKERDIYSVGLCGGTGGKMAAVADDCINVPSTHTARIQEMHIAIGHMLCEIIEQELM